MSDWAKKDEWWRRGKNFLVVVKHHTVGLSDIDPCDGGHRWNVYAFIYPDHPHFAAFKGPDMWQAAACALPLHGGPTFLQYPMFDGKVTAVHVGCDYHHLHDDRFTRMATKEDAVKVFADADTLFNWLQERAK